MLVNRQDHIHYYNLVVDTCTLYYTHIEYNQGGVGFYLLERARTWVNTVSLVSCYTSILRHIAWDPLPEICRF